MKTTMKLRKTILRGSYALLAALAGCGGGPSGPPLPPRDTVVFIGDSITERWSSLPGINRGVSGDTTGMMLARFPADVLGNGYHIVVILGGTNDIRLKVAQKDALVNLAAMAKMAKDAGMVVVLCELPPNFENGGALEPRFVSMNASIAKLASAQSYLLVDYYTPMDGHPEFFSDQLHPNSQGYKVMTQALDPVLNGLVANEAP
jgi:lysophospholipase L1-like esterase